MNKTGRNDPCPCGSGRKYKQCCLAKTDLSGPINLEWRKLRMTEGEVVNNCLVFARERYGDDNILKAWDHFILDYDISMKERQEYEGIFIPWYVFRWLPPVQDDSDEDDYSFDDPIAITFMAEKASQLDEYQRNFIQVVSQEPFTFYAVTDVQPGKSIVFKNIFLKKDITVIEKQASQMIEIGDILFARVITINDVSIMLGCAPVPLPPRYYMTLLDMKDSFNKSFGEIDLDLLCKLDPLMRQCYFDLAHDALHPKFPKLQNTDGDPILFHWLEYELCCSPQEAFDSLKSLMLNDMEPEQVFDKQGHLKSVEFSWSKRGNKIHAEWDNTILGKIGIKGKLLKVEANSKKRSKKIQSEIDKRLGKKAVLKKIDTQTPEKMFAEHEKDPRSQEDVDLKNSPEIQEYVKKMAAKHWENWLDTKIPALKNKTPKEAAKTPEGRERLEALLYDFERRQNDHEEHLRIDISDLRSKLGLK